MPGTIIVNVKNDFLSTLDNKGKSMSTQTFKVAGITVHNGNAKVRFTDDMVRRIKQFTKGGATRADFVELPTEMTKVEALKHMLTLPEFASAGDQATINDALADREKAPATVKVKVSKAKAKPSIDAIKARATKPAKADVTAEDILANTEPALM